jgi:hypothetical protein
MSYATINRATNDMALNNRTIAAVVQEAFENPNVHDTAYAELVRNNTAEGVRMVWPVCIATEDEYASALASGNPDPGGDESVISDGMILSAIQAQWPADPA